MGGLTTAVHGGGHDIEQGSAATVAARIVVLAHDFAGGGTERIALRLARDWYRTGRAVTVLTALPDGPLAAMVEPGIDLVTLGPGGRAVGDGSLISRRKFGAAAGHWLAQNRADIVYVAGNYHYPMIGPLRRGAMGAAPPIVAILSNPIERDGRSGLRRWMFRKILARSLRGADAVVALAPALAAEAAGLVDAERLTVIPTPVLDEMVVAHRPNREPDDKPGLRLLAAGRLMPQKNMGLAIAALAALDRPDARLTLLGDGPDRAALEQLARALGVADQVVFGGHVTSIRAALDEADLFLLPSTFEGYPAVVVEALAAGVPVVATRCTPAIDEMIGDPRLGNIAPFDPQGFADAIAARVDDDWAEAADARRAAVQHHLIGPIAHTYLDLFDRLAARRAS